MKRICLLGASGSIGTQTVETIIQHKNQLSLTAVGVGNNITYLEYLLDNFESITDAFLLASESVKSLSEKYKNIRFHTSINSLLLSAHFDCVVNAIIGFAGVEASLITIELQKDLALANKETLVVAGHLVMPLVDKYQVKLFPIDSEHSAIYQSMQGSNIEDVDKLIITASGGSFRDLDKETLKSVTVEQALVHPNWTMGAKITIDSATMFNKGLEVIEAMWLFNMPLEKIKVVLHYESIVHSMVQFNDKSIVCEMSNPDMKQPIQYALLYPNKMPIENAIALDFDKVLDLTFKPIDFSRFSALKLAYEAAQVKHSLPCVLNAAKEVATDLFLDNKITFLEIEEMVRKEMACHILVENPTFDQLRSIDERVRQNILKEVSR